MTKGGDVNIRDEIARVAHELYQKSGYIPGRDLENWLEAERIVKSRHTAAESHTVNLAGVAENALQKKTAVKSVKKAAAPKKTSARKVSGTRKTK